MTAVGPRQPLPALRSAIEATGLPLGYFLCAPLALLLIWGHRYLPGVDLPAHAELLRLWVDVRRGVPDVTHYYELRPFTPYVLAYVIAYPVVRWLGALVGVKFVLSIAALAAPATMTRWLRAVGGDARLGVAGFVAVFSFAFYWGFLSHCLGTVLLFGYLAAFEQQGERPTIPKALETFAWGALLFFCHGPTFGVAVVCAGLRLVARRRPLDTWRAAVHFVPLGALTLAWASAQEKAVSAPPGRWFVTVTRAEMLFSGLFTTLGSAVWAGVAIAILLLALAFTRPRLNRSLGAWVPFLTVFGGFAILPHSIASTELIGERFTTYMQGFAPALALARPGPWDRRLAATATLLVAAFLGVLNYRVYLFNVELLPFRQLATQVEPGADLETYLPNATGDSQTFGFRGVALSASWLTAENGGIMRDDYAARFNLPVRHRNVPFPARYRYIFTFADPAAMAHPFPDAEVLGHEGPWYLYEQKPRAVGDFVVVRSSQGWGDLQVDMSVMKTPLSVGGTGYDHGLGTHADAWIRLRALTATRLSGACGVDDSARSSAKLVCRVRRRDGALLFASAVMAKDMPPQAFSVQMPADHEVILETAAMGSNKGAHGDWVDLR